MLNHVTQIAVRSSDDAATERSVWKSSRLWHYEQRTRSVNARYCGTDFEVRAHKVAAAPVVYMPTAKLVHAAQTRPAHRAEYGFKRQNAVIRCGLGRYQPALPFYLYVAAINHGKDSQPSAAITVQHFQLAV